MCGLGPSSKLVYYWQNYFLAVVELRRAAPVGHFSRPFMHGCLLPQGRWPVFFRLMSLLKPFIKGFTLLSLPHQHTFLLIKASWLETLIVSVKSLHWYSINTTLSWYQRPDIFGSRLILRGRHSLQSCEWVLYVAVIESGRALVLCNLRWQCFGVPFVG